MLSIVVVEVFCVNMFRYLVSKGAVVDKIGGDLKSTPLHWATRYVEVMIINVNLFLCCSNSRTADAVECHLCTDRSCLYTKLHGLVRTIGFTNLAYDADND